MVSAFAARLRLVVGRVKAADELNEIIAIPALLDMLAIKVAVVTIDAMGCHGRATSPGKSSIRSPIASSPSRPTRDQPRLQRGAHVTFACHSARGCEHYGDEHAINRGTR